LREGFFFFGFNGAGRTVNILGLTAKNIDKKHTSLYQNGSAPHPTKF
jgi:hypothetical protein